MDKEELKQKCRKIAECFNPERLDNAVENLLLRNCINLDDADGKILPSAIMAAFFEDMANCCLNGSLSDVTRKEIKRNYKNIKNFVPASW